MDKTQCNTNQSTRMERYLVELEGQTRGRWQPKQTTVKPKARINRQPSSVINAAEVRAMERFSSIFLHIGKRLIQVDKFQSEDLKMNLFLWIKRLGS